SHFHRDRLVAPGAWAGPSDVEPDVAAVAPAEPSKRLDERRKADLPFLVALRKTKHHCHLPNAPLRARRECTRRCDATQKHHELPPPHARPQGQLRDRSGSNEARKENDVRHGFVDKLPSRDVHSYLKRFDLPGDFQCCRIFDRNSCARSLRGLPKKSAVGASSTISPLSMKITRLATLRAKPISWVTTIMV